jgi:sugar-specific transcriptional regulator TrmB
MEAQAQLIEAIQNLHREVRDLRTELNRKNRPWLTATEAAEILGFPQKKASTAMSGLESHILIKHSSRPKRYLASDVYELLQKVRDGKIRFATIDHKKVLVPLS